MQDNKKENVNYISKFSRYNFLKRKEQVVAVNFDMILIIVSHKSPEINTLFVNTILSGLQGNAEILFVFTKADLEFSQSDEKTIKDLENAGFKTIKTSVLTGSGINELKKLIKGKEVLLVGESAGGKSSLINALVGRDIQKVGDVSFKNNKGCHTTTTSQKIEGNEFLLIDTPGVRYVMPQSLDECDINIIFPELLRYECKFSNCKHLKESGCKVKEAVENGELSKERYSAYTKLIEIIKRRN